MVFFLHSIEGPEGRWTCQHGRILIDPAAGHHADPEEAVRHLREVAENLGGACLLLLHSLDGSLTRFDTEA